MRKPWTPFWRLLPYEVAGRYWAWRSRRRLRRDGIVPPPDATVTDGEGLRVTSWVE